MVTINVHSKFFVLRRYREYIYMKRGNNVKYVLQDEIEGYGHFNNEKILIVDDNDTNLFVVKTILEDRGLIVDTALSGSEGIARFKHSGENEYRIVFLDINMYDMNGYEVSKKIRVLSRNDAEKVPIYMHCQPISLQRIETKLKTQE